MKLSELGEFGLIKRLQKKVAATSAGVRTGIGDDAAVLKMPDKKNVLVTSDMLLEGVHFDLSFTTFYQLGHKFLAVNISDIFAMGGIPGYFIVSIGVPHDRDAENICELYSGIKHIAGEFGISVVGGDTCASKIGLVLSGTLVGWVKDRAITRSGAREGDDIFVTGALGDSAMGLFLLRGKRSGTRSQKLKAQSLKLIRKHLMPDPLPLKDTRKVTSMIDISDGLLADLGHICDESGTGAVIYKENIPVSRELLSAAKSLGRDPFDFALKGGEDYVLLFTAPSTFRTDAYRIGKIIKKGRYITDAIGRKTRFKAEGYEHFKRQ